MSDIEEIRRRARDLGVPVIGPQPGWTTRIYAPNPITAICGACGLELRQTMSYTCPRSDCPTELCGASS